MDIATGKFLDENKSPARRLGKIDNRGSHFYLTLYWAQELAAQNADTDLKKRFTEIASELTENASKIDAELIAAQGSPLHIGGYFQPDDTKASLAMRPSKTLNSIIDSL